MGTPGLEISGGGERRGRGGGFKIQVSLMDGDNKAAQQGLVPWSHSSGADMLQSLDTPPGVCECLGVCVCVCVCAYDMKRRLTALWDQGVKKAMMQVFIFKTFWAEGGGGGSKLISFFFNSPSVKQSQRRGTRAGHLKECVCVSCLS